MSHSACVLARHASTFSTPFVSNFVIWLALATGVAVAMPADAVIVRGRVLDPDGKPVQGARLYCLYWPPTDLKSEDDIDFSQQTKTDAAGCFHFELPRSDIRPGWSLVVIAAADGYGADWSKVAKDDPDAELTLQLVKDQPIEGRILSTEGKPLAGVRVRALTASKLPYGMDGFLAGWERSWQSAMVWSQKPPNAMLLPQEEKSCQAVTDKDGRFRLQGAGAERLVLLRLRGSGITPAVLFIVNRAGFDAAPVNKIVRERATSEESRRNPPQLLYGPRIDYVVMPGRPIEGTVRESGSGRPLAGFRIQTSLSYGLWTVSDEDGHYKLESIPKMRQYQLYASPPQMSSWIQTSVIVDDVAGVQPLRVDFTVVRGVVVSGRVIDKTAGKGVPSLVYFDALPGNKFFDKPGHAAYRHERPSVRTDREGSFRLVIFPGAGVLLALTDPTERVQFDQWLSPYKQAEFDAEDLKRVNVVKYPNGVRFFTIVDNKGEPLDAANAVKVLDFAEGAGAANCDLFVERGATRYVRIEDADGKPLMGTIVAGLTATLRPAIPIENAICIAFALDPKKPRHLWFLHVRRKLAGTLTLRGDEKEPVAVRLRPVGSVIGRVLDPDGQPLAGADVSLYMYDFNVISLYEATKHQPNARTAKDGRFRIDGIVPEAKFALGIVQGRNSFVPEPPIRDKQVRPGQTLDLGDVRVKH